MVKKFDIKRCKSLPTMDDLPRDKANCGNCEYRGADCPRREKRFPNGYVMNRCTGEVGGIITGCTKYEGRNKN